MPMNTVSASVRDILPPSSFTLPGLQNRPIIEPELFLTGAVEQPRGWAVWVDVMNPHLDRRTFLKASVATALGAAMAPAALAQTTRPKLKLSMKYDMVNFGDSVADRFEIIKAVGFQGVEINSPSDIDRNAAKQASEKTGVAIHGVIDSVHWKDTLSDPDPAVRARGQEGLKT